MVLIQLGNVGVQIHHIDPINSGEKVWTLGAEDVANIGRYFMTGSYNPVEL
jgi:Na+-transporting NADH:ubiquinone oxidoreductase subunit A